MRRKKITNIKEIFNISEINKVYFYINPGYISPEKANYHHSLIVFAEGLKQSNIYFKSNIDYFKLENGFLFEKVENVDYDNYDLIVVGYQENIQNNILKLKNKKFKTLCLDWSDGPFSHAHKSSLYDYYFVCSYQKETITNKFKRNNIYPLAFGFTNRILESTKNHKNFNKREINILYSHRCKHYIRGLMSNNVYSKFKDKLTIYNDNFKQLDLNSEDYSHWCQTGRRHNPDFYKTLCNTKICDCTGGSPMGKYYSQIDSFKLWEAFCAGCCVIMIDLDYYKITFPVQPVNMIHYIGVTNNTDKNIELFTKIFNKEIDIESIAKNGRKWALENYGPNGISNYIMDIILKRWDLS